MKQLTKENQIKIAAGLFLIAAVILLASWFVAYKQKEYRTELAQKLSNQEQLMQSYAQRLERDSGDSATNEIIEDCAIEDRERFDTLLGSLSQLNRANLLEVDSLFNACGDFYAKRQAITILRFERELQIYGDFIALLQATGADVESLVKKQTKWSVLLEHERGESELTEKLVNIQDEIISLLLQGEAVQSDRITESLQAAQAAKDSIVMLDMQADAVRVELNSI